MSLNEFLYGYDAAMVRDLQILTLEKRGADVFVNFSVTYPDGTDKIVRTEVRKLPSRYEASTLAQVACVGRAYCNHLKSDHRILFLVTLKSGVKCLLQEQEGTPECNRLLQFEAKPPAQPAPAERERMQALRLLLARWDPLRRGAPGTAAEYAAEAAQIAQLVTATDDVNEIAAVIFTVLRRAADGHAPTPTLKDCVAPAFALWSEAENPRAPEIP